MIVNIPGPNVRGIGSIHYPVLVAYLARCDTMTSPGMQRPTRVAALARLACKGDLAEQPFNGTVDYSPARAASSK